MFLVNDAGLPYGLFVGRVPPLTLSGTFLVKATYALQPGGEARLLPEEEQEHLQGDLYRDDDPTKSLRYASDFAPFKMRTDLFLAGTCHVPGKVPIPVCPVSFQVGSWRKTLAVLGDRTRVRGLLGYSWPDPEPFTEMSVSYDNAYGGPDYPLNRVGKGRIKEILPDGSKVMRLHNLEHPQKIVQSTTGIPESVSFGPIPETWPQRMEKVKKATWDETWLKTQWPWFPKDFDWTFFNAAPPDQQLPAFLRGDEPLLFENLHPLHSRYECRLAGERPRWFVRIRKGNELEFVEVPLVLDTLIADLDREHVVLVWRGVIEVLTHKMKEVEDHFILREPLRAPLGKVKEDYLRLFLRRREEILEEGEVEPEMLQPTVFVPPAEPDLSWVPAFEKDMAELEANVHSTFDPATRPGWEDVLGRPLGSRPPLPENPATNLGEAAQQMAKDWDAMRTAEPGFSGTIGEPPDLSELIAAEKEFDAEMAESAAGGETAVEPDLPWTRERVVERLAADGHFEKEDLSGLDLSGLDLSRRRFHETVLEGTNLSKSLLDESDFTHANLAGANLSGSSLKGAVFAETDLTGLQAEDADFSRARLDQADFSEGKLARSRFREATGRLPSFVSCDLAEADFSRADIAQPDYSSAVLVSARFAQARIRDAGLYEVQGEGADFSEADLTKVRCGEADFSRGQFVKATAPGAVWEECKLEGADFDGADLSRGNFSEADLTDATLRRTNLVEARLDDVKAARAEFIQANLFQSTFEGADLTAANLMGSNLFGVEFWRAKVEGARFEGANLGRTILA